MHKPFVLVVDDEVDFARMIADVLADEGYGVATAHDGQVGLERLREQTTDLVLLDLMMPTLDGPAMLEAMRATPAFADMRVLIMTSVDYVGIRGTLAEHHGVLAKPFTHRELVAAVHACLSAQPKA